MKQAKLIARLLMGGMLLPVVAFAQEFQVFNQANTPVFTTNIFRTPVVDKDGVVYMGSPSQGLYQYKSGQWTKLSVLTGVVFNDMKVDEQNVVWIAQSGTNGGQATTGGVVRFADSNLTGYTYYGSLSPNSLPTRNVRSIYIDKLGYFLNNRPVVWTAHLGDITGGVSSNPSAATGLNAAAPLFSRVNTNIASNASVVAVAGNENEVWVAANGNSGVTQILRYGTLNRSFLGAYDYTNITGGSTLSTTAYIAAMLFDSEGRQWVGRRNGEGLLMKSGSIWKTINMIPLFYPTTLVNNNAIFEDSKGKIYVGTSGGLLVYQSGDVDVAANWTKYTTVEGLPNDNVTGIAEDKKTGNIVITTSGGVAFWKQKSFAELKWDNSYLYAADFKPRGVAADGVARIYIRVFSADNNPSIKSSTVEILPSPGITRNMQGKLKKATTYFGYSEEANDASLLTETDSTMNNGTSELRFWYVAPDDFASSHSTFEGDIGERIEMVRVYVNFSNGSKDTTDLEIKICRPPLLLVHGLNSGPEAWDDFADSTNIPMVSNPLFKHVRALKMDGLTIFKKNALTLLGNQFDPNSLRTAISAMHDKGYACAQVDYVCHSMGGLMLRSAINNFSRLYLNSTPYDGANYAKGYVHKMITINSPHNGSPVADLVSEFAPALPPITTRIVGGIFRDFHLGFIEPQTYNGLLPLPTLFQANGAVKNLATLQANGGINLGPTNVRNHLLTGNVGWTSAETAQKIIALEPLLEFIDDVLGGARDKALTAVDRTFLTGLQGLTKLARIWRFVEWYSDQRGYPNFLGSSDLIVPLASQQARLTANLPHISNFLNSNGSFIDANHLSVLDRRDFGERVMVLLNSPINSNLFSTSIPANIDPEQKTMNGSQNIPGEPQHLSLPVTTFYGTSKVELSAPLSPALVVKADSTFQVQLSLKDTVGLAYLKVYFQNGDTATLGRTAIQQFSFKVNPQFVDSQLVIAVAVYDKPTQIEYHVDTLLKLVEMNGPPTQFRFTQAATDVLFNENFVAPIEAMYNGDWIAISGSNKNLKLSLSNLITGSINSVNAFVPLKADTVQLYANFYSFIDTLKITVLAPPLAKAFNFTVASGNASDPAIWSRKVIPGLLDSVIIKNGHIINVDTMLRVRFLQIEPGGSVQVNTGDTLNIEPIELLGSLRLKRHNINVKNAWSHLVEATLHQEKSYWSTYERCIALQLFNSSRTKALNVDTQRQQQSLMIGALPT